MPQGRVLHAPKHTRGQWHPRAQGFAPRAAGCRIHGEGAAGARSRRGVLRRAASGPGPRLARGCLASKDGATCVLDATDGAAPASPGPWGGRRPLRPREAAGPRRWCRSGGPSQHGLITGAHDGEGKRHGAQGRGHVTLRATTRRTERGPDRAPSVRHSEADPRPLRPAVRFDSSFCATASSPRGLRGSRGIPGESEGAVNKGASP